MKEDSDNYKRYINKLIEQRKISSLSIEEEYPYIVELDKLWRKLSEEERDQIEKEYAVDFAKETPLQRQGHYYDPWLDEPADVELINIFNDCE